MGFDKNITVVTNQRRVGDLPDSYTDITPTTLPNGDVFIPASPNSAVSLTTLLAAEVTESDISQAEVKWLNHVEKTYSDDVTKESKLSWAAFHASNNTKLTGTWSINAMLPPFQDEACSPAMMRHCFDIVQSAVQHVNPGQVSVITVDQPLFAKMKQIQWAMPSRYGEDKFVILLGGFHTELTLYKVLGRWLEGSGWTEALVQADIASSGTAESFLKASHVLRTRNAHKVTACALYILMRSSYQDYITNNAGDNTPIDFSDWCLFQKKENPQFLYWYTTLELELLTLTFVHSLRAGDFQLYLDVLPHIVPWFFSMNNTHYARWMSVHLRDMITLDEHHPSVAKEFRKGKFTVSKSQRRFSRMAIDQAHEQNSAVMKGDGGLIGLTQDSTAILKWAVAGPEIVRVISEFESSIVNKTTENMNRTNHHDENKATQKKFTIQLKSLIATVDDMGNPFECGNISLNRLHSKDIMGEPSVDCLNNIKGNGQEQFQKFLKDRLVERTKAITDKISRNNVTLFQVRSTKLKSKQEIICQLKNDSSLFARLYMSCQKRDGNLETFFNHENQPYPPSLSSYGQLRDGKKSDLLDCLEKTTPMHCQSPPVTDVTIIDGAALVNILRPTDCKNFGEYAEKVFGPYIQSELIRACRVDIVWDQYDKNSLKCQTRNKRCTNACLRRKVETCTPIPTKWHEFLRVDENKTELFTLLSNELMAFAAHGKELVSTIGTGVRCNPFRDTSALAPCNHEEADSRMMVHLADAVHRGYSKIKIRTVDTDVVVIAVAVMIELSEDTEVWIAFGTGKDYRYIPIHSVSKSLGPVKSLSLPVFHAFTGCDTVSNFFQIGKKTAWKVWEAHDELTLAFYSLHKPPPPPQEISSEVAAGLERFTVLLYDRTSASTSVNETRKLLFTRKGRQISSLPPTKAALQQHIKRAALQGGHHWGLATTKYRDLPSPADWGWECPQPLWTKLPQASLSCQELLHCRCRSRCFDCQCARADLRCTVYCTCRGDCENS